jgi:hypothetical protein
MDYIDRRMPPFRAEVRHPSEVLFMLALPVFLGRFGIELTLFAALFRNETLRREPA